MKTLFVVVCSVLLAACLCTAYEGASATIPLLAWSNTKIFPSQNEQYLETITEEDIENTLNTLLGVGSEKGFISVQGNAEVVVLFVEPQLQTDQLPHFGAAYATASNEGSYSALKKLVHTSQSSVVAPYATAGISFSLLGAILDRVSSKASIIVVREEESALFHELSKNTNVQTRSLDDLKDSNIFTNGKTELVVVCLAKAEDENQFAAHDHLIDSISTLVSTSTSGNYVGMYTGNSAPSTLLWTFPNPNAAFYAQPQFYGTYDIIVPNITTNITVVNYFTGPILETFMIMIALFIMIMVGVCNICSLQVPDQYENPKQQKHQM